ncbi:MAG: hypothetical protein IPK67_18790 [Planctomycetes bacterium]|nr:hypothetical protein [Planctomycetota bacterium]
MRRVAPARFRPAARSNRGFAHATAPPGWPRIASAIFYLDAPAAIDWLCAAFGFTVRLRVDGPNGTVENSELDFATAW